MTHRVAIVFPLVFIMMMSSTEVAFCQASPILEAGQALGKAISKWVGRTGRGDPLKEIAHLGGKDALGELANRTIKEGGDEALSSLVNLTKAHGPDVLRAAENAPDIPKLLKAMDDLPEGMANKAVRRLAAGDDGRSLARLVDEFGKPALIAEIRHPGVGGRLVGDLGDDGFQLATRLSTDDVVRLANHSQDIARLPAAPKTELVVLLKKEPEGMMDFMKQFVEQNPNKVLFSVAGTAVVLANSEKIFGGGSVEFGTDGKPYFVPRPGWLERQFGGPIDKVLSFLLPFAVAGASIWLAFKLWFWYRITKLRHDEAKTKIIASRVDDESTA